MFKNLSLKWKFTLIMLVVGFFANLTVAIGALYFIQGFKKKELMREANIVLVAEKAARDYTSQSLRPAVLKAVPKKFVIQGESATFVAMGIAKRIRKFLPDYIFAEPTLNPLNLENLATPFERTVISKFKANPQIKSITGFHKSYFYVMKPVIAQKGCMICHGTLSEIPPNIKTALFTRYGDTPGHIHGFNWKVGHVVGTISVFVPTKYINEAAIKNTIIIAIAIFGLPFIALLIALYFINKAIIKPIHKMTNLAEDVSMGKSTADFDISSNDEIGALAKSFNRLKRSYLKAIEMLTHKGSDKDKEK